MKPLIFPVAAALTAFLLVSASPDAEQPPAGAAEAIAKALPSEAPARPAKDRKILVFSKTAGFRHASIPTGKLALTELGRKTGAFEAIVSDDLANFEIDALRKFDAVVFLNTSLDPFSPSEAELKGMSASQRKEAESLSTRARENLMKFIKAGSGFVGIHAATDTFYNWPEYGEMIGGYFDGHPWHAGQQVSIKVEAGQADHPLAAMFAGKNLEFEEEIYQFKEPYDSSKVHMLLRLDPEKTEMTLRGIKGRDVGVSWARKWGNGRVFYCSLGHNHHVYWNETVLRHYLAGIQWAIGDLKAELEH
jgi:type 1 glutamine amidotransferase